MPNAGGRYEIRGGKRVLVHNTQPAPAQPAKAETEQPAATVPATPAAQKPAKAAAKQEVDTNE